MSKKIRFSLILFSVLVFMHSMCVSVPHLIWPQDDMETQQFNSPSAEKKLLIASRSSEFKKAVVDRISGFFKAQNFFVKITGLEQLKKEDASLYDAVVMINTCMSWDMDRNVKNYLELYKNHDKMIILTTSGDGNWKPKKKGKNYEAVSSASKSSDVEKTANTIIAKVQLLVH